MDVARRRGALLDASIVDSTRGIGDAMTRPTTTASNDLDGGAIVCRTLAEQGVHHCFTINGGHIWPILAHLRDHGIRMIHMRHEQSCAYAADAYARTTGRPGVLAVTAGCGLTNAVTGLCVAGLTGSAVVCLSGQHPTTEDGYGSFQEAYGAEICRTFSRWTKRVLEWPSIARDVRTAFRMATGARPGPAVVEIPTNVLYARGAAAEQRPGAVTLDLEVMAPAASGASIERTLDLLTKAERPLIVAGDGVFWSGAAAELAAFARQSNVPVYARRAAQGALDETDPLAVAGAWKKPVTGAADVVLSVGFSFWSGEHFGRPPTWNAEATHVQIDADPARLGRHVPVALPIVADPKQALSQLMRATDGRPMPGRTAWLAHVTSARAAHERAVAAEESRVADRTPIHPARLVRDLVEAIDADATVVVDSFTLSGWLSQRLRARFPGQVIDAGPLAPVGHGIGMAIGAQLARPGKQVVVAIGDGGLGIAGLEIETALRLGLPIVAIVWNNSSWGPSFDQMPMLRGRVDPFEMLPNLRYDRMFEAIGCHAEHVEQPDAIRPAIDRALAAGRAAVVNVIGDATIGHPRLGGNLLGSTVV